MKFSKLLLISFFLILISSCGSDDDNSNGSISLLIDGTRSYEFNDNFGLASIDEDGLVSVVVEAKISNTPQQSITMFIPKDEMEGTFQYFYYNLDGTKCNDINANMNYNLTTYSDSQIIGTFSGSINCNPDSEEFSTISNGTINISY